MHCVLATDGFVQKEEAEAAWERYMSSNGDHLTLLNIGRAFKKSGESKVSFFYNVGFFYCLFCYVDVL